MPFKTTEIASTIFGDQRVKQYEVEVIGAKTSNEFKTGLGFVYSCLYSPVSAASASFKIKRNLNSKNQQANGIIFIDKTTKGDKFFLSCLEGR